MAEPPLLYEVRGAVAHLVLNRPAVLNALDQAMGDAFAEAAARAAGDARVRAVVLRGAGRGFMAGGDVGALHRAGPGAPEVAGRLIAALHAGLTRLTEAPKPVIAGVHGAVAGAGVSLMLAADLAVAADDARFTLAYAKLGASADGGASWALPRVVGLRKAMEIALLNGPIDAREALRLSLVNRVVPAAELAAETEALAARLAEGPTFAYGQMKRLLRGSLGGDLPGQLAAEKAAFEACAATPDFKEGVAAFVETRAASFLGL